MLAFLLSPLGKIALYVAGALAAIGIIWGAISYHDSQVKKDALFQYNQMQLEQTVKDQADQIVRLNTLNTVQQNVVSVVSTKNNSVSQKSSVIEDYINNQTAAPGDTPSPVIVETLKRIKEMSQ